MKLRNKRLISLLLAVIMMCSMMPIMAFSAENDHAHTYENGVCAECGEADPAPYAGKTIACIGDSITCGVGVTKDETDYVTLLAKSLQMNYIRLGVSGTTLCTGGHRSCNIGKLTEENLSGADVVTVLMGINDFDQARDGYYALGNISSKDTSTIYGALHMWCQKVEQLRKTDSLKDTEFYFLTPVITSWNHSVSSARNWDQSKTTIHGYTLRDLCNAIIEVCSLYDINVIDLNLISGMYYNSAEDNNVNTFGGDGVHPGANGHQMMANAIEKALLKKNLYDDHAHNFGSWITTRYPKCDNGEKKRVCQVCAATESEVLNGAGHTYENGTCAVCGNVKSGLSITQQPSNTTVELGERFTFTVEAEGDGLTYQWYYKDASMNDFAKSCVTGSTYSFEMLDFRVGREYYCVISDQYGSSVKTDTVKSTIPLTITEQPTDVTLNIGEQIDLSVKALGEGLSYQWYYKDLGDEEFSESAFTGTRYSRSMEEFCNGRQVYCVITDAYGNSVQTDIATVSRTPKSLSITAQPVDIQAEIGQQFEVSFEAEGDGLTYQWYYKDSYMDDFAASASKTKSYSYTMQEYRHNRQVYCVVTDQYGNSVETDVATLSRTYP